MTAQDGLQHDVRPPWRPARHNAALTRHGGERPHQTARPCRWLNGVRPTGEPKHQHHCRSLPDQPPRAAVAALPSKEDRCPPPVTPPSRASRPRPLRSQRSTFGVPGYHQQDRRRGLRFYLGPNRRRLRPLVVPYAPQRGAASAA